MFTQTHLTSRWGHMKTCMRKWRRCKRYQNENPEARKIGCHIPERIWFLICMGCKIMQSEGVPHFTRGATRIRSQISPALQPNSERFQQGSRTVPVFRGMHFRVTSPRPQRLKPNRFAVGNVRKTFANKHFTFANSKKYTFARASNMT